jgi:hypothetical protein
MNLEGEIRIGSMGKICHRHRIGLELEAMIWRLEVVQQLAFGTYWNISLD